MPGFDGSGPTGMGPMTGGARGWCNPYGRHFARSGFGPWSGWGRGYRHMYWATAMPRWMRSQPGYSWSSPFAAPPTRGQEMEFLNDQAVALKEELEAIQGRLRDIEKEAEKVN